ncbi:MAG: DUF4097 family beta strand repeat-containing protein [bacterium]|nr:DUF4097 family beta strand repeat-containing protein [bacterium]MDY4099131.1 DUF4097 family beta strand repeat-containing protein [Lachnospiraceae bacterium]
MNKLIRALLITCGVCVAVGGGLLIAGIALGGTWDDATVTIGEEEYDVRDAWDDGLLKFEGKTSYAEDSDQPESGVMTGELEETADQIRELKMTLRSCELQITQSKDDQIRLEIEKDMEQYFDVRRKEHTLTIEDTRKTKKQLKAAKVTLQIPADHVFEEVHMEAGAGTIRIDRLVANDIDVEGGAGKIEAQTLIANQELDAEIGAGDFYIKEAILGDTELACGVGHFEIESCELNGNADISSGVGEVNVGILGEKKDFNYDLSCGMGELQVFDDSFTSLGKDKEINNGAKYTIKLECGMGRVNVYQAGSSL